jgi:hypothetical protein
MLVQVCVKHPDLINLPYTSTSADYSTGTTLTVANGTIFSANDYILIDKYGSPVAEMAQVASSSSTSITLISNLQFPHQNGSSVTKMTYNQFQIARSNTGIGGTYNVIYTGGFAVSQADESTYNDINGNSAYSYQVYYYNSTAGYLSASGGEALASNLPLYTLGSIQDRTLSIYVDRNSEFISKQSIADWCNEFMARINRSVTDSETTLFANFAILNFIGEYIDLTNQNIETIFLVEYSTDGGITYTDSILPMDSRIKAGNPLSIYTYKYMGEKLFIYSGTGNSTTSNFPTNYPVRVWFYTQQPLLINSADTLPAVYRSYSDVFVDYCLMRANEQSRRLSESAAYYYSKLFKGTQQNPASVTDMINSVRSRIDQGNKAMSLTWLN